MPIDHHMQWYWWRSLHPIFPRMGRLTLSLSFAIVKVPVIPTSYSVALPWDSLESSFFLKFKYDFIYLLFPAVLFISCKSIYFMVPVLSSSEIQFQFLFPFTHFRLAERPVKPFLFQLELLQSVSFSLLPLVRYKARSQKRIRKKEGG